MGPGQRHQGRHVRARSVGNRNRRYALLCLIALVLQLALPVVHAWYAATGVDIAVPLAPAWTLTVKADSLPVLLSSTDPEPRRWHHDPALCQVCQTLTQARNYLLTPARAVDMAGSRAQCLPPAVYDHCDPYASAASPRAPPVLS